MALEQSEAEALRALVPGDCLITQHTFGAGIICPLADELYFKQNERGRALFCECVSAFLQVYFRDFIFVGDWEVLRGEGLETM